MDSIIFYITDREEGTKAVQYLCEDIKARQDAEHKLYFKFLLSGAYMVSMGCEDTDGNKHFIGEHEIIFMPVGRQSDIERLKDTKNVIWYKNCMIMAGDSDKTKELRQVLIDWLLEIKSSIDVS